MTGATMHLTPFGAVVPDLLRRSFASVKECAIAAATSPRTVERWWRGERLPNAAQWLLMELNSDPFGEQTQLLRDELKQQRTETHERLERLRASRPRAMAALERKSVEHRERVGSGAGRSISQGVRFAEVKA